MSVAATLSLLASSLLGLSACAVGPDFTPPPAPPVAGYTPDTPPAATVSVDVPGGTGQQFVMGRDIPGDWWKVFHSKEIDALVSQALQANPSLQAAQAALWQAKETLYAAGGKLLPSVDANSSFTRQQFSPAEFGLVRRSVDLQSLPGDRECLLCARRVRRPAAADRGDRGGGGIAALRARGDLSDADRERGDGGHPGSLAARPDRGDRRNHQGGNRPARRRAQSIRSRRRQPRRRADPGIRGCDHAGDACRRCRSCSSNSTICCSL